MLLGFAFVFTSILFAQTERWVYRYNGPGNSHDYAHSIVYGMDGNIYAAGQSFGGEPARSDFTVISLTSTGTQRWVYRYPNHYEDNAWAITYGQDHNIYAAGYVNGTAMDLAIISLTSSGALRWIYTHNGPLNSDDYAVSIIQGSDGNIYAAGRSGGISTHDLFVVSLTPSGTERWVYYYDGSAHLLDAAYSISYGPDGNLYIAGHGGGGAGRHFIVLSLTTSGELRWVYDNGGTNDWMSYAYSLTFDQLGNVYACGYIWYTGSWSDFTVVKLDTSGNEQWIYRYNSPWNGYEGAYSIVYGADGNIYAAGAGTSANTSFNDLLVISLTPAGEERWIYYYGSPSGLNDGAEEIVYGDNGKLYITGYCTVSSNAEDWDMIVIEMDTNGVANWIYRYDGPGHYKDQGEGIVFGSDNNIYVAGWSCGANQDFLILSLTASLDIAETLMQSKFVYPSTHRAVPNPFFSFTSIEGYENEQFQLFDASGRYIGVYKGDRIGDNLPAGLYFVVSDDKSILPARVVKIR
ncbi:MAG: hypothetical protein ABIL46_00075 [candidate division WOR-3 bacterium]